jgi:hypothetical protein
LQVPNRQVQLAGILRGVDVLREVSVRGSEMLRGGGVGEREGEEKLHGGGWEK